jgi:hypothetical protein
MKILAIEGRKARHDAIVAYAAETAGTHLDLDRHLEAASIEHLLKSGRNSFAGRNLKKIRETVELSPGIQEG